MYIKAIEDCCLLDSTRRHDSSGLGISFTEFDLTIRTLQPSLPLTQSNVVFYVGEKINLIPVTSFF